MGLGEAGRVVAAVFGTGAAAEEGRAEVGLAFLRERDDPVEDAVEVVALREDRLVDGAGELRVAEPPFVNRRDSMTCLRVLT